MIFVVNAGSSSIKVALFDGGETPVLTGIVSEIGGASRLSVGSVAAEAEAPTHEAALALLIEGFAAAGHPLSALRAAGHRVVHGGGDLVAPASVTEAVLRQIEAAVPLAPLHNPHNLSAIRALMRLAPDLPQVACFDTGFHATSP